MIESDGLIPEVGVGALEPRDAKEETRKAFRRAFGDDEYVKFVEAVAGEQPEWVRELVRNFDALAFVEIPQSRGRSRVGL